jgi:hypothetical protein
VVDALEILRFYGGPGKYVSRAFGHLRVNKHLGSLIKVLTVVDTVVEYACILKGERAE